MSGERNEFESDHKKRHDAALDSHGAASLQFDTPEELLRHDAARVEPPESVAARLRDSVERERGGGRLRAWWRGLFSS